MLNIEHPWTLDFWNFESGGEGRGNIRAIISIWMRIDRLIAAIAAITQDSPRFSEILRDSLGFSAGICRFVGIFAGFWSRIACETIGFVRYSGWIQRWPEGGGGGVIWNSLWNVGGFSGMLENPIDLRCYQTEILWYYFGRTGWDLDGLSNHDQINWQDAFMSTVLIANYFAPALNYIGH